MHYLVRIRETKSLQFDVLTRHDVRSSLPRFKDDDDDISYDLNFLSTKYNKNISLKFKLTIFYYYFSSSQKKISCETIFSWRIGIELASLSSHFDLLHSLALEEVLMSAAKKIYFRSAAVRSRTVLGDHKNKSSLFLYMQQLIFCTIWCTKCRAPSSHLYFSAHP